ncbi:MAG: hypothetical protein HY720_08755 [Planctomycetes bacterium]|nr:hypothetical protein [Planctomycetota bacterium]
MLAAPRRLLVLALAAALGLPPGAGPFPTGPTAPQSDSRKTDSTRSAPAAGHCGAATRCCCSSTGAPVCRCRGGARRPGACFEAPPGSNACLLFVTHQLKDGKAPPPGPLRFAPSAKEMAPDDGAAVPPSSPALEVPVHPPRRA